MKGIELMAKRIAVVLMFVIALFALFVGCASNKERQGVVVRDTTEFLSALQNKETLIFADDLTFDEDTVVQINYGLTITGNGKKATIKNAHFKIISPNVAGKTNSVTFENIILDGGCYEEPAETDKTFEEVFGGEREEKRCITADWGYTNLVLKNVEIKGYASIEGSALYIGNKFRDGEQTLSIENCDFHDNVAKHGTLKVFNDKLTTKIESSNFYHNTVGAAGGFVISNGKAEIKNCNVSDNAFYPFADLGSEDRGGGVYIGGVDLDMADCVITGNETKYGGGLALTSAFAGNGSMLIKNCRIENNRAEDGGAVFIDSLQGQPIDFIGCEFYGNTATNKGSILYTQPYAYWTKKYNGGQINLLFSKAANNTAPDSGTFHFYESDGLLGYIVLRGCMVIGDDEYETSPSAYNYIATATKALDSGAINDLNITDGESVYAVKKCDADIYVPANVYRSWHSAFAGATLICAIGEYNEIPAKPQIDLTLTIVLVVIGAALSASFVVLIVVFRKKRKTNVKVPEAQETGTETSETEEQQPVAPVMTEKERIDTLTEREYKIVALTLSGKTREQIAEELHFSVGTIKFDLMNIYRKLACSSRTDLILRYKDYF